jgi:hypothetical protein
MQSYNTLVCCFLLSVFGSGVLKGQVGIGTTMPNPRAVLDLSATDQGFLPPRVDHTMITGLALGDAGLWVFNPSTGSNWY